MPKYKAFFTNCIIAGENWSIVDRGKLRNIIRFKLDQFECEFTQKDNYYLVSARRENEGKNIITSEMIIQKLKKTELQEANLLSEYLAELLSFITGSEVAFHGYEFVGGRKKTVMGSIQNVDQIIRLNKGENIRLFLESTWLKYKELRDIRKLNVAFDYYVSVGKSGQPVEVKLVLLFVLLEHLKHTYAMENGYPFLRGFFRELSATTSRPGRSKSFRALLGGMLSEVGINNDLSDIIDLRNEIIHSGISVWDSSKKWETYIACQNLVREYFLRLLEYRGQYQLCEDDTIYTM